MTEFIFGIFAYKSSLKAEAAGLLADRAAFALETTTGMGKESDSSDSPFP